MLKDSLMKATSSAIEKEIYNIAHNNPNSSFKELVNKILVRSPAIGVCASTALNKAIEKIQDSNHDKTSDPEKKTCLPFETYSLLFSSRNVTNTNCQKESFAFFVEFI